VAKYAADWPAWGHRKIYGLMRADGHRLSMSGVERAMRRRGLLQSVDYQGERRELAKARKAAFAEPPTGPNQVWQLDFSEYETATGGIWRLAGCCDYYSKYEYGWHIAPTCTGTDAIEAVRIAIAEAESLAGGIALLDQLPVDPDTGRPKRIKLVTDNGGAFKGHAFAAFIASRSEFVHIRTRRKSPGQNGVRERAFGSLKHEHLYRCEIETLTDLARQSSAYRHVFNHIRPHEALGFHRPIEVYRQSSLKPTPKIQNTQPSVKEDCERLGWFARLEPGRGWVPCDPDTPGAQPDINRLYVEAEWEPITGRWQPKVENSR